VALAATFFVLLRDFTFRLTLDWATETAGLHSDACKFASFVGEKYRFSGRRKTK
jgi:hypothetical protein